MIDTRTEPAPATGPNTHPESTAAMTVDEAHRLIQAHMHCATSECGTRRAALAVLVAHGHYVLDLNPRRR